MIFHRQVTRSVVTLGIIFALLPFWSFGQELTETPVEVAEAVSELDQVGSSGYDYKIEQLPDTDAFGDFVVGPGKFEVEIAPGQTKIVEITVTNRLANQKQFKISFEDMMGSTDPKKSMVLLGAERGPYTLRDYLSVPDTEFQLNNGERIRIPVTISIPPDAEPGGHYGSVLISTVTKDATSGNENNAAPRSAVISRIGTLFFISAPGEKDQSGSVENFTTRNSQSLFNSGPITFDILFENTGTVHLSPYGGISITNIFNEEVGFVELQPWYVLPSSLRSREIDWNRDFLFGKYVAHLKLNRGYNNEIDEATVTFWVIPWTLVASIFVSFLLFFLLIKFFFRTFEFKRKTN